MTFSEYDDDIIVSDHHIDDQVSNPLDISDEAGVNTVPNQLISRNYNFQTTNQELTMQKKVEAITELSTVEKILQQKLLDKRSIQAAA